jgi:hypothetical protein
VTRESLEILNSVNRCQIAEVQKAGQELDPQHFDSCNIFANQVRNLQAAIIHTYQITAAAALRESDPEPAAKLWKEMSRFCDEALNVLKVLKDTYPDCGTPQLYDLTLDYRGEAEKRYYQNLQDAECARMPIPQALFPSKT